ncbi:hypothetical protein CMV_022392 [Castanea mollissima]|uniref:Uncharacterized protein n=1 Tax=Castanea mollissima TaxID=60419 RepID=A0A8J4QSY4_9ROSI|nr:hypothetical protein CMV_022392 [Castanea mollissima]
MADWAPVVIGVVLFVLLQPGLLFQLPGHNRQLDPPRPHLHRLNPVASQGFAFSVQDRSVNPGDKRMNKTTATTTGPQSAPISLSLSRLN